jgi:photosystem II stability/assembly factor-like uncharacterized protein
MITAFTACALFAGDIWTFQEQDDDEDLRDVFAIDRNTAVIVGEGKTVLRTEDGGRTWRKIKVEAGDILNSVSFSDDNHGWIACNDFHVSLRHVETTGFILVSLDGGRSWKQTSGEIGISDGGQATAYSALPIGDYYLSKLRFFNKDLGVGVCENGGPVLVTGNGGRIWIAVSPNIDKEMRDVRCVNGTCYAVGKHGAIIKSSNSGVIWREIKNVPDKDDIYAVHVFDENNCIGVGERGVIFSTSDGGATWSVRHILKEDLYGISFMDRNTGWTVGDNGTVMKTVDGGKTWAMTDVPVNPTTKDLRGIHVLAGGTGWVVGDDGIILKLETQQSPEPSASGPSLSAQTGHSQAEPCFPQCRRGYICRNGQCVSLCNPPCPSGQECGDDGACRPAQTVSAFQELASLAAIRRCRVVDKIDSLRQGFIFITSAPHTRVTIGDTSFIVSESLFVETPAHEFKIFLSAPNYQLHYEKKEIVTGQVTEIRYKAHIIKGELLPSLGLIAANDGSTGLTAEIEGGIRFSTHYLGFEGFVGFLNRQNFTVGDTTYSNVPKISGGGVCYGYTGFCFFNRLYIIPRIMVGQWTSIEDIYASAVRNNPDILITSHRPGKTDIFYAVPGLEIRAGTRMIKARIKAESFIGTALGIYRITAGIAFTFP